jgi:hypothetical protein
MCCKKYKNKYCVTHENKCYIVQEREFVKTKEKIFKLGRTKQKGLKRFKQYPKGTVVIIVLDVDDCIIFEKQMIKIFDEKFICRRDIGREYYEGDSDEMINEMKKIKREYEINKIIKKYDIHKNNIPTIPEDKLQIKNANTAYKHECNFCNHKTNDTGHYNRHLKTQKHITRSTMHKIEPVNIPDSKKIWTTVCPNCPKIFRNKSAFYRHKLHRCKNINIQKTQVAQPIEMNADKLKIQYLEEEIKKRDAEKIKQLENHNKTLENHNKVLVSMVHGAGQIAIKSMNALDAKLYQYSL